MNDSSLRSIDLRTQFRQIPDLQVQTVDGGLALLAPTAGALYQLDDIAADVWRQFDHPNSVAAVCHYLLAHYDVTPETCQRQVLTLMRQWVVAGLIQPETPLIPLSPPPLTWPHRLLNRLRQARRRL